MNIYNVSQIRAADAYTIAHEPVASVDLMERAARACYHWFHQHVQRSRPVHICCGMGNNGGDGLALARMLAQAGYRTSVTIVKHAKSGSPDFSANLGRLEKLNVEEQIIGKIGEWKPIPDHAVLVDALLGSGLNKPLSGLLEDLVKLLNNHKGLKVAVDIPTGLFADDNRQNNLENCFRADVTLTFQFPKLAMLLPGSGEIAGKMEVLDIGLHPEYMNMTPSQYHYTTREDIAKMIKPRQRFDHKGSFGHALLIAGSKGKMGAAVLAAKAALRAGCGLLTVHIPGIGNGIVQTAVPEAMVHLDQEMESVSYVNPTGKFNAAGIGPGMGMSAFTTRALLYYFIENALPMVVDADALNILSVQNGWDQLQPNTILTPHPGELKRMTGDWSSPEEMLEKAIRFAETKKMIVVLKNAYTAVCLPSGEVHFNSSGCAAMATAGSGDVLTGIITSLLAQGYEPGEAAITGVYIHGKAGEKAAAEKGEHGVVASDLVNALWQE